MGCSSFCSGGERFVSHALVSVLSGAGGQVVAQDIPLFKVAAAGGIADVVPAVARLLQHGDGGAVRGAGLDGVVRPRAGADIQSAAPTPVITASVLGARVVPEVVVPLPVSPLVSMFSPVPSPVHRMAQEAVWPPAEAVMVTDTWSLPLYTLVMLPYSSTVAMFSLLLVHSTVTWASSGTVVTVSWKDSPAWRATWSSSVRLRVRLSSVTLPAEVETDVPPLEPLGVLPNSRGDRVVKTITTAAMIRTREMTSPATCKGVGLAAPAGPGAAGHPAAAYGRIAAAARPLVAEGTALICGGIFFPAVLTPDHIGIAAGGAFFVAIGTFLHHQLGWQTGNNPAVSAFILQGINGPVNGKRGNNKFLTKLCQLLPKEAPGLLDRGPTFFYNDSQQRGLWKQASASRRRGDDPG